MSETLEYSESQSLKGQLGLKCGYLLFRNIVKETNSEQVEGKLLYYKH